jgi:hypothetical protein
MRSARCLLADLRAVASIAEAPKAAEAERVRRMLDAALQAGDIGRANAAMLDARRVLEVVAPGALGAA